MKKSTQNRMYMLSRITTVIEQNKALWETDATLSEKIGELNARYNTLQDIIAQRDNLKMSWKEVKVNKLKAFTDDFEELRKLALGIAKEKKQIDLIPHLQQSITKLARGAGGAILSNFKGMFNILEELDEDLSAIAEVGALKADLIARFESLKLHMIEPSARKKEMSILTKKVGILEPQIMEFVEETIDPLFRIKLGSNADFIRAYEANREVPNYGATSTPENPFEPVEAGAVTNDPPAQEDDSGTSNTSSDDTTI